MRPRFRLTYLNERVHLIRGSVISMLSFTAIFRINPRRSDSLKKIDREDKGNGLESTASLCSVNSRDSLESTAVHYPP